MPQQPQTGVEVVPWRAEYRAHFERLNLNDSTLSWRASRRISTG